MTRPGTAIFGGMVIVAVVFAALVGIDSMKGGPGGEPPGLDPAVSGIFEKFVESANALKGAEVETDVIFGGATVEGGRLLTYTYTVAGVANRPFDLRIARMAEDQLNRESCADKILRRAIDGGGAVRYVYFSSGGTRVLVIEVDRQSCLKSE